MSDPFLGEIRAFSSTFVPRGWAPCDGALLPIAQNQALFTLLGTAYGGDGQATFALPDLRGRTPLGRGQGPGLSSYAVGQAVGAPSVALDAAALPAHGHGLPVATGRTSSRAAGNADAPGGAYGTGASGSAPGGAIGQAGGSQPHANLPPYTALTFGIAVTGIYPPRS